MKSPLFIWVWLLSVSACVYFGWTNILIGLAVLQLRELVAGMATMNVSVLATYALFEKQVREELEAAELEQIEESLAKQHGVGPNGEVVQAVTWPPVSH